MRGALKLARVAAQIAAGWVLVVVAFPLADARWRAERARRWCRATLDALGVEIVLERAPGDAGLVVANHVSWLDVLAIGALQPSVFVAKDDVRQWPLLGAIASGAGTIFIDRARARAVASVNDAVAARLRDGNAVVVFPEGTTTDGSGVIAFRSALFESALAAGTPVVPVALSYHEACGRRSADAAFCGDTGFLASLWRVARAGRLVVRVEFLDVLVPAGARRRDLADGARARIALALSARPA